MKFGAVDEYVKIRPKPELQPLTLYPEGSLSTVGTAEYVEIEAVK